MKSGTLKDIDARLQERAESIEGFFESHLVDSDGLVYSTLDENTRKPVKDKVRMRNPNLTVTTRGKITNAEVYAYEDTDMATAEYLLANIYKYQVTASQSARRSAKKCFTALKAVAEAGKTFDKGFVRPMFGFLPKPYGGIAKAHLSGETSCDQYTRVLCALELYKTTLANQAEKKWIDGFFLAAADFWNVNHYTTSYFGNLVRWGIMGGHAVASAMLYSAIGAQYEKSPHESWFNIFLSRANQMSDPTPFHISDNVASLIIMSMKWLCSHRPGMSAKWIYCSRKAYENALAGVDECGRAWLYPGYYKLEPGQRIKKPHWIPEKKAPECKYYSLLRWRGNIFRPCSLLACGAADLFEMTKQKKYRDVAVMQLGRLGEKGYLKYAECLTDADLPTEYKFIGKLVCGLNSAAWLRAYWQTRHAMK